MAAWYRTAAAGLVCLQELRLAAFLPSKHHPSKLLGMLHIPRCINRNYSTTPPMSSKP